MPRPAFQQPESGAPTPPAWESLPWTPEDRVVEEPRSEREQPLRLSDDHVLDAALDSDSIRRAD
jgi:hypothetical protein